MQEKQFTVGYSPSSDEYYSVAYAVDPDALYAKVVSMQVANTSEANRNFKLRWSDNSARTILTTTYWGDGISVKQNYYTHETHLILDDVFLPPKSSIAVLDEEMYLQSKDLLVIKPSVADKMTTLISIVEYFGDEITDVKTRKTDYDQIRVDFEGDTY